MKDILETIVKHLVENQDAVKITEVTKPENENLIEFKVNVAKEDMGKIIGKQGKNARAIRTVMKSVAAKERKKVDRLSIIKNLILVAFVVILVDIEFAE